GGGADRQGSQQAVCAWLSLPAGLPFYIVFKFSRGPLHGLFGPHLAGRRLGDHGWNQGVPRDLDGDCRWCWPTIRDELFIAPRDLVIQPARWWAGLCPDRMRGERLERRPIHPLGSIQELPLLFFLQQMGQQVLGGLFVRREPPEAIGTEEG